VEGGLLASLTDARGGRSEFTYDDEGLLLRDEDPDGGFQELDSILDGGDTTVIVTTAMGRVTRYSSEAMDNGDRMAVTVDPAGGRTEVLMRSDGSSTVTYPNGNAATVRYGPDPRFGMLAPVLQSLTLSTPGGLTRTLTQSREVELSDSSDIFSLVSLVDTTRVNGRTYTYAYQADAGSHTETTPAGVQQVSYSDGLGRTIRIEPDSGVDPIIFERDDRGRVERAAQGLQSWDYVYDGMDRLVSRTLADGRSRLYTYDDANRLTQIELPGGETVSSEYDSNGNRAGLVMPNGERHVLGYTARNALESYTPPGGVALLRSYDLDKALQSRTLPSGRTLSNSFDATTGQWTGMSYAEADINFAHHPNTSLLASLLRTPAIGTPQAVDYEYDGTLLTEMAFSGAAVGTYAYAYDANFLLTGTTLVSGGDVVQTDFVRDPDGRTTTYGPFTLTRGGPSGETSRIADSTATLEILHDAAARVDGQALVVNAAPIYGFDLVRNAVGRIESKLERVAGVSHTYTYAYDDNGRLASVTRDGVTLVESYSYDANGNRTSTLAGGATHDVQDRIITDRGIDHVFDVDGFLTSRGADVFAYSARGELLSATISGNTISYDYDGLNRRVARTSADGTTEYLYGNPSEPFLVTESRAPDGTLSSFYYDEQGLLFALERGAERYYVGTDQVGTPKVVADSAGIVVLTREYDSFGVLQSDSNVAFGLPLGYAGGLEDPETGLVRFVHRDYDAVAGRWTARDPILYSGFQANLYAYVGSDPINQRDPVGLFCVGASGYAGVGGGAEVCCSGGECSLCVDIGFGGGFGGSVGPGDAKERTSREIIDEVSVRCGPFGAGAECKLDRCGKLDCSGKADLGGYEIDTNAEVKANTVDKVEDNCGFDAKAVMRTCTRF